MPPPPTSQPASQPDDVPPDVLLRWRAAEEQLYPVVMVRPDLYQRSIELVRSVADELKAFTTPAALLEGFDRAAEIAAEVIRRESLEREMEGVDLGLATTAAFSLRYRELVGEVARGQAIERIRAARERGDAWVVLHESGALDRAPAVPYRRLEMHLATGSGLHLYVQQDPETAAPVYGVEPVQLDPQTGDWLHEASQWAEPQLLAGQEPWRELIGELRGRLAGP
jgi:hypothetical protein